MEIGTIATSWATSVTSIPPAGVNYLMQVYRHHGGEPHR